MGKAIFTCAWANGSPALPPLRDEKGGLQLVFKNAAGEERGGFCSLGADRAKLAAVLVFSSAATIKAMAADTAKYIFLEEHKDEGGEWVEPDPKPVGEIVPKPGMKALGDPLGEPITIDPIAVQPLRAAILPFLTTCKVAYSTLPTTKEPITRWLKTAARATDEAIAAADMT
jgi:hypothetical protein